MKKILIILLSVIIILQLGSIVVLTAENDDPIMEITGEHNTASQVLVDLKDAKGKPSETIAIDIVLDSDGQIFNSIGLRDLVYDDSVLTFKGFELSDEVNSSAMFATADEDLQTINIGFMTASAYDMPLGRIYFKINANAPDQVTAVEFTSIIKNSSTTLASAVDFSSVTVQKRIWGDMDDDGDIDIDDAILLYQHSMMPDLYPIE